MCEAPQTSSDLRQEFDRIERKWLHERTLDLNELDKDLQGLKGLIVKNSDDSKLVIYIKNKAIMEEPSYKLDTLTPIILSFIAIVLSIFDIYDKMINSISGFFTEINNIEKIIFFIVYIGIPVLIMGGCAFIIIETWLKHKHDSRAKKFYAICLNTLWPQLPAKNEVNNPQNLKCIVKINVEQNRKQFGKFKW